MPIEIDEFDAAPPGQLQDEARPVREKVLGFLAENPEQAYSRTELQATLNLDTITLLHELSLLEGEGLLRHKAHYWAIEEGVDPDGIEQAGHR